MTEIISIDDGVTTIKLTSNRIIEIGKEEAERLKVKHLIRKEAIEEELTILEEVLSLEFPIEVTLQEFFNMLKTYTKDGKMITDTELNAIAEEYGLTI